MLERRTLLFLVTLGVCTIVAAAALVMALSGSSGGAPGAARAAAPDTKAPPTRVPEHGALVFRSLDRADPTRYGHIAWAPLDDPERTRTVSGLGCERVHFAAATGLCLARGGKLGASVEARILDRDLKPRATLDLSGIASRARVSPDGRYGAVTAFVSGHSYADPGAFSTVETIIDMRSGEKVGELEKDFTVLKDGERFESIDFNFWGVTFARDSDRFYATLGTGGKTYLLEGSVSKRRVRVLRENAECPSLSPDNSRVVYKKLVGDQGVWRYHVLDLETGKETPLAETRPIDDQAEWLDDERILYRVDEEIWTVPADGSGAPRRFLSRADSPAVVR